MRWLIFGGILALAVAVYALVDLTVTDDRRIRRLNRVLWVVLIVIVPVVGPLGWMFWGKGPRAAAKPMAPDDDPSFGRSSAVTDSEADRRIALLEAELAALDDEDLSGREHPAGGPKSTPDQGDTDSPGSDGPAARA